MSTTTHTDHQTHTETEAMTMPVKTATVAEALDLDADHDIDLIALVTDLEDDGYTVSADPDDATVDEILARVAAYSTSPIPF